MLESKVLIVLCFVVSVSGHVDDAGRGQEGDRKGTTSQ